MPKMIRPPNKGDATRYLRMLYAKTEQELIREIARKRASNYVDYAEVAALKRVQETLQDMVDESWDYAPTMIETIFYKTQKDIRGYRSAEAFSVTQTAVVEQLTNNFMGEIMEAAVTAERSTRELLGISRLENDPFRAETLKAVAQKEATGGSHKTVGQMTAELNNQGITAFVDKRGREWSLNDYANMATRTTARQAQVAALLTADEDHDLYRIVKIGTTCPICAPLEDRVYSKSGSDPDYPALSLAFGKVDPAGPNDLTNTYLNIHPNCLHSIVKYTTIGKTDKQIQRDKDFSNPEKNPLDVDPRSKRQIEEYRKKTAARQQLLSDKKQHQAYREVLGNEAPKDFAKFQELKYNEGEEWKKSQASYRKTNAYNKIIQKEPEITADLMSVSKSTGVNMAGLENRVKGKDSFLRKVGTKSGHSLDPQKIKDTISSTNDVIRYTYQDSALSLADSYKNVMGALQEKGYEVVQVKNFWKNKGNPYNGINCTFRTPKGETKGQSFEIQFHTPESYGVKDRMHKDYEAWRVLDPASSGAIELRKKMMEQSQGMEIPANIKEVK